MKNLQLRCVVWMSVFMLVTVAAAADIVTYSDLDGDFVLFQNLTETSTVEGPVYGQPTISGDTIRAPGTGFLSQSVAGDLDLVDGRLQLSIIADEGFQFDQITVTELGSFFGAGESALSIVNSFASVQSGGESFSGGVTLVQEGVGQGGWFGEYTISFPETDEVTLTLNNQLLTSAGLDAASFIEGSSFSISVNAFAASVPEPGTATLSMIVLAYVCLRRRRLH